MNEEQQKTTSLNTSQNIDELEEKATSAGTVGLVCLFCVFFVCSTTAAKYTLNQADMVRVEREQAALGAAPFFTTFLSPASKQQAFTEQIALPTSQDYFASIGARPHAVRLSQLIVVNKERDEDDEEDDKNERLQKSRANRTKSAERHEHTCAITASANTIAVHHDQNLSSLRNGINATSSKLTLLVGDDVDIEANSQFCTAAQYV